jgi:hypothetical protein
MKWMPMTLFFLFTEVEIALMGSAEVFEARIVSGGQT